MKICNICNVPRELEDFDKKKNGSISGYCKECRREKMKSHYNRNKEYYVKKARKNNKKYISKFEKYKTTLSCTDCGLSFRDEPYLCDFHHINGDKEFNISERRNSFRKLEEELKKCIPLCPICHRRRHALLAKLDTASEYESEDFEGSNPSQSTYQLPIQQIREAIVGQNKYWH